MNAETTKITCCGADLTYQYSEEGELTSGSGLDIDIDVDTPLQTVPDLWERKFLARWVHRPEALPRLRELVGALLASLPNNQFAIREAWLAGVIPAEYIPSEYLSLRERILAEQAARKEKERLGTIRSEKIDALIDEHGIRLGGGICRLYPDEEWQASCTGYYLSGNSGRTWVFVAWDVFDVGQIINPLYSVEPGDDPGGILVGLPEEGTACWQKFVAGEGWTNIRALEPEEAAAYLWVERHTGSSQIRM